MTPTLIWTFLKECDVPEDIFEFLNPDEFPRCAFKTIRDTAIFTNKRIIVKDLQGVSGKKVKIYSLPYTSIKMYSTENVGRIFDATSEVELWTLIGYIKINLGADVNIREFDKIISDAIL